MCVDEYCLYTHVCVIGAFIDWSRYTSCGAVFFGDMTICFQGGRWNREEFFYHFNNYVPFYLLTVYLPGTGGHHFILYTKVGRTMPKFSYNFCYLFCIYIIYIYVIKYMPLDNLRIIFSILSNEIFR